MTTGLGLSMARARQQHDLLDTADLRGAGLAPDQVTVLVRDGVLERVVRGLYRIGGSRTALQDVAAAVSRHRDAVASHTTALFLHGVEGKPPRRPHLTVPLGSTSRASLGRLHRSPLPAVDTTVRHGIAVTTVARAVVDAAEQLSVGRLDAVVAEVITRRLTTVREIADAAARVESAPGRVGSGRVREVLGTWTEGLLPESPAEAAAIRRIVDFGLPSPVTQHEVRDPSGQFVARLDMAWPDELVAREYDSDRFHAPHRIEADEVRRQRLESLGWRIGAVHRGHLVPSRTDWLHALANDLRRRRRHAS